MVQNLSQVEKKVKSDENGKFIEEDEDKFAKKETKIKAKLDEIDALSKAAKEIDSEPKTETKVPQTTAKASPNCKACKKCKAEKTLKKVISGEVETDKEID